MNETDVLSWTDALVYFGLPDAIIVVSGIYQELIGVAVRVVILQIGISLYIEEKTRKLNQLIRSDSISEAKTTERDAE